jgi:hypothetical protein
MLARIALVVLSLALFVPRAPLAAIPDDRPSDRTAVRMLADARAAEPAVALRGPQSSASAEPRESSEVLRRELVQQASLLSGRFDEIDGRIYEIVGRLQLLTICLIALFLGMFVWQMSLAREIARLKASVRGLDLG